MRRKVELKKTLQKVTGINLNVMLAIVLIYSLFFIAPGAIAQPQNHSTTELSGEELFIQYRCVRCHTIGRGKFVGPDLAGVNARYSDQEIIQWIENPQQIYQTSGKMPLNEGYPPMPPMNVPPDQAESIAEYVAAFKVLQNGAQSGSISGQVLNETLDGPAPEVELTLTSYMGERPTDTKTIKSDEQGNFQFDKLNWDRSYEVTVNYKGAQYATDKMVFFPDEETKILNLPIFEPTIEEDDIEIVESHMIVQSQDGTLSVADLTLFNNKGDNIYVGGKELEDGRKESLRYHIPKDAQKLSFIHGINPDDIIETDYGFADTTSIMPGQRRVVYTYDLPPASGTTNFEKTIDYPTENFLLLVSDLERTTEVSGLSGGETTQIQGESFQKWTGTDLKPGHIIKVELKGPALKIDYIKWGALGFLVLIVVAGVIYSLVSKEKTVSVNENEELGEKNNELDRTSLIKEIASLDDKFETGQIGEVEYRKVRADKLSELKKITRRP